jgi:uncharacterized protein YjbI with pentapeptide repeats
MMATAPSFAPACRAGRHDGGNVMPDSPAQETLLLLKTAVDSQTERLATPEELDALKRIVEVESAISDLMKSEQSLAEAGSAKSAASAEPKNSNIDLAEAEIAEPTKAQVLNVESTKPDGSKAKGPKNKNKANLEPVLAELLTEDSLLAKSINSDSLEASSDPAGSFESPQGSWLLELASILDQHRIWVETGGEAGTKADLCGANLENADLTGVNLQGAFLQRANLRGADLSMANLRHASLVQADLCNANLLGAELRGANLMGATLYGAEGLWLGRLGGANLYDAMLPETISSIDGSKAVWEATRSARWFYFLMLTICSFCILCVATTSDARLILDGQTVPIGRLGNVLPINGFYLIAPILLLVLFVRFQFLLLRVWSSMAALPAVFPDGQTVERGGPWYLMGLVRRHFRWLRETKTPVSWLENVIATLLAYWAVPSTIALLWVRYLVRQDLRGTSLHVLFFVLAVSVATGLPAVVSRVIRSGEVRRPSSRSVARMAFLTLRAPIVAGFVLLLLSIGVILGVPAESDASRRYFSGSPRRWAAEAFHLVGYRPYADLIEAKLVPSQSRTAPSGSPDTTSSAITSPTITANDAPGEGAGAKLNENSLRYARAYRAALGGARLWRANLSGAYLTEADLRNANLREAHLRDAVLDHAKADHALFISADGKDANLTGADLRGSDLTYATFENANFASAKLGGASFYGAALRHTSWLRADLTRSDMRDTQLQDSEFSLANLELTDFSGAKLANSTFGGTQFKGTILLGADLRNADLRGAAFPGAVLRDVPLDGARMDGADFRGALGLTATQVCSAKGWTSAQFDADVLLATQAQCGTPK